MTTEAGTSRLYMVWHCVAQEHDARQVEAGGPHEAARKFVMAWVAGEPRDGRMVSTVVVAPKNREGTTTLVEVEVEVSTALVHGTGETP